TRSYPSFDPLAIFAEDGAAQSASSTTGQTCGAKVESDMSLKTVDFPLDQASFDEQSGSSTEEEEQDDRAPGLDLSDGGGQATARSRWRRFTTSSRNASATPSPPRPSRPPMAFVSSPRTSPSRRAPRARNRQPSSPRKSFPSPPMPISPRPSPIPAMRARTRP